MSKHKILSLTETCTGCFACANACPKDAITLPPNFEGFYFPAIDVNKCVDCGLCDKVCPQINDNVAIHTMQGAYYGWSTDNDIRKESSSGGLFYYLATSVLNEGGVVYGASFNYEGLVRLECHSTEEVSLKSLMRSKYVQNYIGYAYRGIRRDLRSGKIVLYCCTPCQAAGLKAYLGRDYENLICVDFICHGVPSMDMLQKHLQYLRIDKVKEINFRPKNRSWVDDFEIRYTTKGRKKIRLCRIPWEFDEYFWSFQTYKNIRRSCRNCAYCNGNRAADITLADFWGIKRYKPELWDVKGQSLVLVNTHKGEMVTRALQAFNELHLDTLPVEYAQYVYERVRTTEDSPYQNKTRDSFLKDVYTIGYKNAIVKYGFSKPSSSLIRYRAISFLSKVKKSIFK